MIASQKKPYQNKSSGSCLALFNSIIEDEIDYSVFDQSEDAPFINFLNRMLTKDQEMRATVTDLLEDPYLTKGG